MSAAEWSDCAQLGFLWYSGRHKSIQHTVRYTELAPTRFKGFWRD